jgi:hypothetical protein
VELITGLRWKIFKFGISHLIFDTNNNFTFSAYIQGDIDVCGRKVGSKFI